MELPKRKQTRLKEYDYSTPGAYFITICTKDRKNILSNIVRDDTHATKISLSKIGEIAKQELLNLETHYPNVKIDKYVIMPNHIHLIIKIDNDLSGGHGDPPLQVFDIIGRFKSFTMKKCDINLWQRSFHDHIIRDEEDYLKIWNYIDTNPQKWNEDCFYTK